MHHSTNAIILCWDYLKSYLILFCITEGGEVCAYLTEQSMRKWETGFGYLACLKPLLKNTQLLVCSQKYTFIFFALLPFFFLNPPRINTVPYLSYWLPPQFVWDNLIKKWFSFLGLQNIQTINAPSWFQIKTL